MIKSVGKILLSILMFVIFILYLFYNLLILIRVEYGTGFLKLVKIIASNLYQYNILLALIIIMVMIMLYLSIDFKKIGRTMVILFLVGGIIAVGVNVFYVANAYLNTPFINKLLSYADQNQVDTSLYFKYSKKILMNTETGNSIDLYSPSNSVEKIVIFIPDCTVANSEKTVVLKKCKRCY